MVFVTLLGSSSPTSSTAVAAPPMPLPLTRAALTPCSPLPLIRAAPPLSATDAAPHGPPLVCRLLCRPPLCLRPALSHRHGCRDLSRPHHLTPATVTSPPSAPS